ncbi:Mix23p TBLA_0I00890, partial [Henningerozyma blattae CBS 6284]
MSDKSITVKVPQIILDSNLEFGDNDIEIKELTVTRTKCINPTLVDSFLRLLRHSSDDIIRQRINDYSKRSKLNISKQDKCNKFVQEELYPNWKARTDIINYCHQQSIQIKNELDSLSSTKDDNSVEEVNLRIDPYGERDCLEEKRSLYNDWDKLQFWVKNNQEIETILQRTSSRILQQTCDENKEYVKNFLEYCR